jgi:V/A-type H+-transporting ATPase subunit E
MSLENLLDKIEDDGREEGARIVAEAKREVEGIIKQGEEEARLAAEEIRESYRERAERERVKIMSEALSESRTIFLSTQDSLYNDVFTAALIAAEDMPEERYREWLKGLVLRGSAGGDEEILAAEFDRRLLEDGLLEEINVELGARGGKGSLSLAAENAEFSRGVILKSEKMANNLSLEAVMREVRDKHEAELLRILFGAGGQKGSV